MPGRPAAARPSTVSPLGRLGPFVRHAPGLIAILGGPDHVCEFANAAYLDLVGGRDVIGKRVRDALPELEEQGVLESMRFRGQL
jgi:hypothetical protein